MGVQKLPNRRMYSGTFTNVLVISETMTRNRFDVVLTILHFNDNKLASPCTSQDHNKLHKIELVIEFFNARFNEVVFPETNEAVDEMMIPFKGKHSVKMYMTKKPVKWGYKLWCRAGISGYVYEFEILGGKGTKGTSEIIQSQYIFGESENVVMRLVNNLQPREHKVFFDNVFTSAELMLQLKDQAMFAVGTFPQDRSRGCKLPTEKEMKHLGRRTIHQFNKKIVLFFVSGLIIVRSSRCPISLVRIIFPMQSDIMVRRKRWCKFHALPVLRYTIGSLGA